MSSIDYLERLGFNDTDLTGVNGYSFHCEGGIIRKESTKH